MCARPMRSAGSRAVRLTTDPVYYDELHPSNEAYTQPDGIVTVSTMHQLPSVWPRVFS